MIRTILPWVGVPGLLLILLGLYGWLKDLRCDLSAVKENTGNHIPTLLQQQLVVLHRIEGLLLGRSEQSNDAH